MKNFDFLVFIGRFQPFHIGHKQVIETALTKADKVIVLIGSAFQPRTIKNPFTAAERMEMIFEGLNKPKDVITVPIRDYMYNDQRWAASVGDAVRSIVRTSLVTNPKIGIIGHTKDESSYYLKMFPQWTQVEHEMNEVVNATDIRSLYFEGKSMKYFHSFLPEGVYNYLDDGGFRSTDEYRLLKKEYEFIQNYKKGWEAAPYPPTFLTVDAVVVQSGHVLLVKRKSQPGAGLLALPGGFINQTERIEDAMIRKLREETKLRVPAPVLRGSIKAMCVFDHPNRSLRGRTITHAYLIELPPGELPAVKGGDDAKHVMWVPFGEVKSEEMFEDHNDIIQYMLGRV